MAYYRTVSPLLVDGSKEMFQRRSLMKNYIHKGLISQGELVPECIVRGQKTRQVSLSSSLSSSSSSSSSSDSEEENKARVTLTLPKSKRQLLQQQRRLQQSTYPKWFTVVDLEGCFHPAQITAKLNPKEHILVVKAKPHVDDILPRKQNVLQQSGINAEASSGETVRVIPLPENIHLRLIKVQMTSDCQKIIVKAPFVVHGEEQLQQLQTRYSSSWLTVPITIKDIQHIQHIQQLSTISAIYGPANSSFCAYPTRVKETQKSCNCSKKQFIHIMEDQGKRGYFENNQRLITLRQPYSRGLCSPQYIRDPMSGKLAMIIKVNTVGFLPQDILVLVDQSKRVLIVEADIKKSIDRRSGEMNQQQLLSVEQGVSVKYFRREFVLPQWMDVTHIGYCALENGLLTIQLPLVKSHQYKLQKYVGEESNVVEGKLKNVDWKRPATVSLMV